MMPFALALAETPASPDAVSVLDTVAQNADDFIGLVTKIGDVCVNNEICIAFLTVTFMTLGVRMVGRIIRAFGRGR